jgi:type IV secretory pathway TraG/TraD family ATPase VirD4
VNDTNYHSLLLLPLALVGFWIYRAFDVLSSADQAFAVVLILALAVLVAIALVHFFSPWAIRNRKRLGRLRDLPTMLLRSSESSVQMGTDVDLEEKIYLPDSIRTRHVHILGATGSGKTESVILNFLRQDLARGLGAIILDAKGDISFLEELERWVPSERLRVFDLSGEASMIFDPLSLGSPLESAQRLFSSLVWSEEYYKSKALSTLQTLFQNHFEIAGRNPTLVEIAQHLANPESYNTFVNRNSLPASLASKDYQDISGLRDQIRSLTLGNLNHILSPSSSDGINLIEASSGAVIYFRLQSLMSPQIVAIVGRLIINNLNYMAGVAHRKRGPVTKNNFVPVYLDEFASFACPEFADLISKARSAGFALHFSHQSVGDLTEVSPAFINRITDNAATKIVMRINDPDSAEFFARCFGTKDIQKTTQRITNAKNIDSAEVVGEGTTRDAHQFRASPDLLKTLPTGMGAVLVAHGQASPDGASCVFKIKFPVLKQ